MVRLTIGANRRYRCGAVGREEESERWKVKVPRRGSVRVERPVRQGRSAGAGRDGSKRLDRVGVLGPGSWHGRIGEVELRRAALLEWKGR